MYDISVLMTFRCMFALPQNIRRWATVTRAVEAASREESAQSQIQELARRRWTEAALRSLLQRCG
jgi:hypothetical protein